MSTEGTEKKRSESRKRRCYIRARVTPEELAAFRERCANDGLSDADFIRKRCLDLPPLRKRRTRSIDRKSFASALGQLGKVGSNINQMAHALNVMKFKESAEGLLPTITAMEQHLARMEADNIEVKDLVRQALLTHDTEG